MHAEPAIAGPSVAAPDYLPLVRHTDARAPHGGSSGPAFVVLETRPGSVMNTVVSLSRYRLSVEVSTRPGNSSARLGRCHQPPCPPQRVRSKVCAVGGTGLNGGARLGRACAVGRPRYRAGAQGGLTSTRRDALLCGCDRDALGLILRPALETLVGRRHVRLAEPGGPRRRRLMRSKQAVSTNRERSLSLAPPGGARARSSSIGKPNDGLAAATRQWQPAKGSS